MRSEPAPESLVLVTTSWSVFEAASENCAVSPVLMFVAVAVIRLPGGTLLGIEPTNVTMPVTGSVDTVVEPISVSPSLLVDAVAPGFEKNWMRKFIPGTD